MKTAELAEGDRVLVKNVNIRGKHKLADKWERPIHIVVKRIEGGPVYVVKPETGKGPQRTLHRDVLLLLLIMWISASRDNSWDSITPK